MACWALSAAKGRTASGRDHSDTTVSNETCSGIQHTFAVGRFRQSLGTIYDHGLDAFPILKEDSPLRHQNQPPDGTRPLRRIYVTRLP
jgi:hypothetical protein